MANGTGSGGGSVMATTTVAMPVGASLIVAQYLVHPVWPPPDPILTIFCVTVAPIAHLIGRTIYRRLTKWADDNDGDPTTGAPEPASPPNPGDPK